MCERELRNRDLSLILYEVVLEETVWRLTYTFDLSKKDRLTKTDRDPCATSTAFVLLC